MGGLVDGLFFRLLLRILVRSLQDEFGLPLDITKKQRTPDSVQLPARCFENGGTEHVPLDRILGLFEAHSITLDADRGVARIQRVPQGHVDPKTFVAPMDDTADAMLVEQLIAQCSSKQ